MSSFNFRKLFCCCPPLHNDINQDDENKDDEAFVTVPPLSNQEVNTENSECIELELKSCKTTENSVIFDDTYLDGFYEDSDVTESFDKVNNTDDNYSSEIVILRKRIVRSSNEDVNIVENYIN